MSIDRRMDKDDVVPIYNGILLNHKKEKIASFVDSRMDLESIIQSKVSQKEKNEYHIVSLICGI